MREINSFLGVICNNVIPSGCTEPVEDSSQADSSSDQEERDHALDRAQKGARPLQPRKRKENDGASRISPVKRPRHEGARATEATKGAMRPPITTSISAPGSFNCILSLKLQDLT